MIPAGQDGADCTLRVLEADVSTFNLSHARGIWADATDVWDGILICYDATEKHSLAHVQDLLCTYVTFGLPHYAHPHYADALGELHAPVIVLACKSELEQRVNPTEALAMLKPYDIGLVEASTTTEAGKERIRKAFQWVLKAITRPPGMSPPYKLHNDPYR